MFTLSLANVNARSAFGKVLNLAPQTLSITTVHRNDNYHTTVLAKRTTTPLATITEPATAYNQQTLLPLAGKTGDKHEEESVCVTVLPHTGDTASFVACNTQVRLPNQTSIQVQGHPIDEAQATIGKHLLAKMPEWHKSLTLQDKAWMGEHVVVALPYAGNASRAIPTNKNTLPITADGINATLAFVQHLSDLGIRDIVVITSPKNHTEIEELLAHLKEAIPPLRLKLVEETENLGDHKLLLQETKTLMTPDKLLMTAFPDSLEDLPSLLLAAKANYNKLKNDEIGALLYTFKVTGDDRKQYGLCQTNTKGVITAFSEQPKTTEGLNDEELANGGVKIMGYPHYQEGLTYMEDLPEGHTPEEGGGYKGWLAHYTLEQLKERTIQTVQGPWYDFGANANTLLALFNKGLTTVKTALPLNNPLKDSQVLNEETGGRMVVMPKTEVMHSLKTYNLTPALANA